MYGITSLAFFVLSLKMTFGLEPQCTPFHYQEQMIEKMIKLEIFVQKMKDDMTVLQEQVIKETEILKADNKLFKTELETEKTLIKNDIYLLMNTSDIIMKDELKKHAKVVEAIKGIYLFS